MADPVSNWLYRGAGPGTQAATKTLAQTTPWGQVGKQILGEGGFGIKGRPGGFGSVNVGFDPGYKGAGATGRLGYTASGLKSLTGATVPGNIGGGTPAGRLAFEKLLQSPFAKGVSTVGRLATGPIGLGITAGMTGAQLGDWAYRNWEPATKFGDWAGGGIYDYIHGPQMKFKQQQLMNRRKQDMQQRIRQGEAAAAAKQKAAADAAAAAAAKKQYSGQGAQGGGGGTNIGGGQQTSSGIAGGKISHGAAKAARGNMSGWGLADGGLINFYRYGGFI